MGQAQSQSLPFDCRDCFAQGQGLHFGAGGATNGLVESGRPSQYYPGTPIPEKVVYPPGGLQNGGRPGPSGTGRQPFLLDSENIRT